MKNNNINSKFARKMLKQKAFELPPQDYDCVIKALNSQDVNRHHFVIILKRYRGAH